MNSKMTYYTKSSMLSITTATLIKVERHPNEDHILCLEFQLRPNTFTNEYVRYSKKALAWYQSKITELFTLIPSNRIL
jgi:hypothetical protein